MITHEEKNRITILERTIEFKEQRIKRLNEGIDANSKGWKSLKTDIDISIKACQTQLEALASGAVRVLDGSTFEGEIRSLGGQLKSYRGVLFEVEDRDNIIENLNDQIGRHYSELKQLREKTGDRKLSKVV